MALVNDLQNKAMMQQGGQGMQGGPPPELLQKIMQMLASDPTLFQAVMQMIQAHMQQGQQGQGMQGGGMPQGM